METESRTILQETDYRALSLEQAGKLDNHTPQELLQNADKIYNWLMEEKRLFQEKRYNALKPKWKQK